MAILFDGMDVLFGDGNIQITGTVILLGATDTSLDDISNMR